jgi:hypothetical protein
VCKSLSQANLRATIQQFNTDLQALINGDSSRYILPASTDLVKKAGAKRRSGEAESGGVHGISWP